MAKKATAIKIPTETTLFYNTGTLSSNAWTGGKKVNIIRDLAAVNRHNVAHTSSRGVPYVVRAAVTFAPGVVAQASPETKIFDSDVNLVQIAEVHTIPNTWVTRNALVKTHAARENMFKQQGVRKSERGAYDKTLRPTLSASPDTWLAPRKGSTGGGAALELGTWEYSQLKSDDGDLNYLPVIGDSGLLSLYLDSRKQIGYDSNSQTDADGADDPDDSDQPKSSNILRSLLSPTLGISAKDDDVTAMARDNQDNPPYSLDNNGAHTDLVLAGRQFIGPSAGMTHTEIYDIPLGMFEFSAVNAFTDGRTGDSTIGMTVKVEVLGIYEM